MSLIISQRHGFSARRGSPVPDLLWWQCNEGSGTSLVDSSSGGAAAGAHDADYVAGPGGSALDFNGTSDDGASSSAIAFGTSLITVSFWVNRDNAGAVGNRIILESSANHNSNNDAWVIYIDFTNSRLAASFQNGAQYRQEYCTLFAHSEWHHVTVVMDRNYNNGATRGRIWIYVDGVAQSMTVALNTLTSTANFGTYIVYLAARSRSSIWLPGLLDDIRIYSGDKGSFAEAIKNDPQ